MLSEEGRRMKGSAQGVFGGPRGGGCPVTRPGTVNAGLGFSRSVSLPGVITS